MTEADARRELKRKLVFGDERQIKAVRLLDDITSCVEQLRDNPDCFMCGGLGEHYQPCPECKGDGCDECTDGEILDRCPGCDGLGLFVEEEPDFSVGVLRSARSRIRRELRRQFA